MASLAQNETVNLACYPYSTRVSLTVAVSLALPCHIMMIKILAKDLELSLPRHQITVCLSVSDALQIFIPFCASMAAAALDLTTEASSCHFLRDLTIFFAVLTIVVTSLTLVTLAIERMTMCMYVFKYHIAFSRSRTRKVLCSYWLVGVIIASVSVATNEKQVAESSVGELVSFQIISVILILPSAVIITIVYCRLYLFCRTNIKRVVPDGSIINKQNLPESKRRQIHVAYVTGVMCGAFNVCMLPITLVFFLELLGFGKISESVKLPLIALGIINTVADPLIYGFGIKQTRQILLRNLESMLLLCTACSP